MDNHTEIVVVLDRSGSMSTIRDDAIGSFNEFLSEQKKQEGTANITLVQFDSGGDQNGYELIYKRVDIQQAADLTTETFVPRGGTALLDALGRTMNEMSAELDDTKVIFVILTDGQENSSHEFNRKTINERITEQRQNKEWEFVFLAANQDAIGEGIALGISAANSVTFVNDSRGMRTSGAMYSNAVSNYRTTGNTGEWKSDATDDPRTPGNSTTTS